MLISFNFLKKMIHFNNISLEEIIEKMNFFGYEVEDVINTNINNLIVGEVKKCVPIEGTHLKVCDIFLGKEHGIEQIVCGAGNIRENIKVIVALPGAELPKIKIAKAKIRGYDSNGMCCSLTELGVDKRLFDANENGIYELNNEFSAGETNILEKLGFSDVILNVKLPYNRPDLISMIDFSKELSKLFNFKLKTIKLKTEKQNIKNDFKLKIESEKCNLFFIQVIKNVFIKETPTEIKKVLLSFGINPINNIVDYANYVMILTGCPINIYDYDKFLKKELIIKNNDKNYEFLSLNNEKYLLNNNDIVAFSNDEIVSLSGIMCSSKYSFTQQTKNIVIEIGNFDHFAVRRTSLRLNLLTESSRRFMQNINSFYYEKAFKILDSLIKKDCKKCLISNVIGKKTAINKNRKIYVNLEQINNILNAEYNQKQLFLILKKCFLKVKKIKDCFVVYCDDDRNDIQYVNDVAEEVLRFSDFTKIKNQLPKTVMNCNCLNKKQINKRKIEKILRNFLYEVSTYILISEDDNKMFDYLLHDKISYEVINPIVNKRKYVRRSLLPSLLKVVNYNLIHQNNNFGIFEISDINFKNNKNEKTFLSIVLSGSYTLQGKMNKIKYSIFYLKGLFNAICDSLNIDKNKFFFKENFFNNACGFYNNCVENQNDFNGDYCSSINFRFRNLYPGKNVAIFLDNEFKNLIGFFGQIHPDVAFYKYGIKKNEEVFVFEVDFSEILNLADSCCSKFISIPNVRFVERDLCLLVDKKVSNLEVTNIIKNAGGDLVKQVDLFDVYENNKIQEGKKSMSFNIIFLNEKVTLTNIEVNKIMEKILLKLKEKNIVIRE